MEYISIYQIINLIALLIIIRRDIIRRQKPHMVSCLLLFTCLMEIVVANVGIPYFKNNILSYNINCHGLIIFYYLIFRDKKWGLFWDISIAIWLMASIYYVAKNNPFLHLNINTYIIGLTLILGMIFKYFHEIIFGEHFMPLGKDYKTWIGLGIAFFYLTSFTILVYIENLIIYYPSLEAPYFQILSFTNIFLSLGYLIAAIKLNGSWTSHLD